jgi:hypothetical protein
VDARVPDDNEWTPGCPKTTSIYTTIDNYWNRTPEQPRKPTCRILRVRKSVNKAQVLLGVSAVTAAPFFESEVGQANHHRVRGQQLGNKMVLWKSLNEEDQEECLKALQKETVRIVWCIANHL